MCDGIAIDGSVIMRRRAALRNGIPRQRTAQCFAQRKGLGFRDRLDPLAQSRKGGINRRPFNTGRQGEAIILEHVTPTSHARG